MRTTPSESTSQRLRLEIRRTAPGVSSGDRRPFGRRKPAAVARPTVHRLRTDDAIRAPLLETVRDPTRHSADGEGGREQWHLEAEAVEKESGIELDVRLKATSGLVLLQQPQRHALDAARQLVQLLSSRLEHLFGRGGEHAGARIADSVDAVAEAHQLLPRLDLPPQHRLGA